jgi:hypothetical protein
VLLDEKKNDEKIELRGHLLDGESVRRAKGRLKTGQQAADPRRGDRQIVALSLEPGQARRHLQGPGRQDRAADQGDRREGEKAGAVGAAAPEAAPLRRAAWSLVTMPDTRQKRAAVLYALKVNPTVRLSLTGLNDFNVKSVLGRDEHVRHV